MASSDLISNASLVSTLTGDAVVSVATGVGQPQKNIKLSDLATVVAGMLPGLLTNWFQPRTTLRGSADADSIKETGIYRVAWEGSGSANFPLNMNSYFYGFMLVFALGGGDFVQIVINESNQICVRQLFDSAYWRPWIQIS